MLKKILFFVFLVAALFVFFGKAAVAGEFVGGEKRAWTDAERTVMIAGLGPEDTIRAQLGESPAAEARVYASLTKPTPQPGRTIVIQNPEGQSVAMLPSLPSAGSLPAIPSASMPSVPAMPTDGVRPQRPVTPKAPPAVARPQAPSAPAVPRAPQASQAPPAETAKTITPQRDYPKGKVIGDQAKRLYLKGQPIGEIRVLKGRLKGELVNVDQNILRIHIWPGNYISRMAIPVDRGQYNIAYATGKGWVISPEKTSKIPAGCEPVRIGD